MINPTIINNRQKKNIVIQIVVDNAALNVLKLLMLVGFISMTRIKIPSMTSKITAIQGNINAKR